MYDSPSIFHHGLLWRLLHEGGDAKQNSGNNDTGIRDVEGRPGIEGRESKVKTQKVHDIAVEEPSAKENAVVVGAENAVGEVA